MVTTMLGLYPRNVACYRACYQSRQFSLQCQPTGIWMKFARPQHGLRPNNYWHPLYVPTCEICFLQRPSPSLTLTLSIHRKSKCYGQGTMKSSTGSSKLPRIVMTHVKTHARYHFVVVTWYILTLDNPSRCTLVRNIDFHASLINKMCVDSTYWMLSKTPCFGLPTAYVDLSISLACGVSEPFEG